MEGERGRREQMEKARLRGSHALRMVHLEQDRKRLMKELEQMQHVDLERRRQIVSQMPPQLFEPPYRRMEIKDDWQRELEFAFEDMYTGEKRVKGDLILRLEPHPLPLDSAGTQDEDLDLSFQPEIVENIEQQSAEEQKEEVLSDKAESVVAPQAPSKLALKKLLNKIRTQKDTWTSRSTESSDRMTTESGPFSSEERHPAVVPVPVMDVKSAPHQSLPYFSQERELIEYEELSNRLYILSW
ncbi:centrosomal protein of 295 kDa-like [Protopterus annectens]|uniref:centrosomal protein of 295 kDa-like n=1 Tax=Protopterus annectens TaxID=7888 RepID=UPI001CFB4EA3|nr:centrosomal protein of 295 kDa-like [Protopterus annectens]